MIIKHRFITVLNSIVLAVCFAAASPNIKAQTYSLTDLGVLPGQKSGVSTPAAINTSAMVAGTSGTSAFRYDPSDKTPLKDVGNVPAGSISHGLALNASGIVVGDSTFGSYLSISHAAIFAKGSAADLGTLKGDTYSRANGINAPEQVVGFSGSKPNRAGRAFIWSAATGIVDLGTLGGQAAEAFAINDAGLVTGTSETGTGLIGATHAFIYQPASITSPTDQPMRDLGTLGGSFSYGMSINVDNHVVGYSTLNGPDNRIHAFLYDGVTMRDLGTLGGKGESDQSFALSVNMANEIVGYTYRPVIQQPGPIFAPQPVAFFYSQGVMVDLNTLIGGAAKNYRLDAATAINDKGQIVATAFDSSSNAFHAVLLTPTGEITNRVGVRK